MDQFGLIESKGIPVVGSRNVAEIFSKRHDNVVRNVTALKSEVSEDFWLLNFQESKYKDSTGRRLPEYLMTKDGFTLLAMGFTGKKAMEFKIAYITRFNEMEQFIKTKESAKLGHPAFTEAVALLHDHPAPYHFSNESDLINRLVLGMTAKQFKDAHSIPKTEKSIRPYLTLAQITEVEHLQMLDAGMMAARVTYEQRKMALELALMKFRTKRLALTDTKQ